MPDVERVILRQRMALLSDTAYLIDDNDMVQISANLEEDFTSYTDEDLQELAYDLANETVPQIYDSLLNARTQLRTAVEEVDTIEMFQNQEPDWEV